MARWAWTGESDLGMARQARLGPVGMECSSVVGHGSAGYLFQEVNPGSFRIGSLGPL